MAQRSTALAVLAAVVALAAAPAAADDRVAFTGVSGGLSGQLFSVPLDGTLPTPLSDARHSSTSPAFSPDGARIAFGSDRDFAEESEDAEDLTLPGDLYSMPFDGGEVRRLTSDRGYEDMPAWSPAGDQLAFARLDFALTGISADLWAIAADGTGRRQLTVGELAFEPAWSPDGLSIAYTALRLDDAEAISTDIKVVPAAGGASRVLVPDAYSPAFSPDGALLAFASTRDRNGEACIELDEYEEGERACVPAAEVYVARADGSEQRRVTDDPADDADPAFAPDGGRLVFASDRFFRRAPSYDLWTARLDGSCPTRITATAAQAGQPAWRPHGRADAGPLPLPLPVPPGGPAAGGDCPAQPALAYLGPSRAPARRWRGSRALWAGETFRGLALSSVEGGAGGLLLEYADCVEPSARCGAPVALHHERCPETLSHRGVVRRHATRGALATVRRGGVVELLSGGLAVTVLADTAPRARTARARRAIAALGPFGARRARRLPAPALRPSELRELRAAVVAVRRHGLARASRRLAVPRAALRDRLAIARALRRLGRPSARDRREAARCDRRAQRASASAPPARRATTLALPGGWRWLR